MNSFFLCINPLVVPPPGITGYIYHYDKPRFFASIQSIDREAAFTGIHSTGPNVIFQYTRGDGLQQLVLIVLDQKVDRVTDKLNGAFKQAAGWYAACLARQDAVTYSKSSWALLMDYNKMTPQLQIIELTNFNKYLVSHPDGIFTFDNADTMDNFLNHTLEYSDEQLEEGYHNYF
jgi:hypothetical protein